MEYLTVLYVLVSLVIGQQTDRCKEGGDHEAIVPFQRFICDYRDEDSILNMTQSGLERNVLGNGSVECILRNSQEELSCMAIMKYVNVTDASGNFTRELRASSQGCWTRSCTVHGECPAADECVKTQSKNSNKAVQCCCRGDMCNRDEKLQLLPYKDDSTTPFRDTVVDDDSRKSTLIIVSLIVILLLVSALLIILYYIYRTRKEAAEKVLQMKMDQYNYDMRIYSDEPPVVNYDDMVMGTCIHRGRFGDVFKATLNEKEVCVKYFHAQQRTLFYTEKEIYSVLDPLVKSVVQCLACDERAHPDGTIQYIVIMEYMPLGSLASYLKTQTLSWRELCSMAQTAAAGIGYLHTETIENGRHKNAVVHRDINSRNILVRSDMTCAIADMGFSLKIRGSKVIRDGVEEHAEDGALRDVGTVRYMAPEILECAVNLRDCESSLKQIDMYAFSLVLWELVTRCRDILFETKRYMLPFEDKLGTHPTFETMRIHVAKENNRPVMPVTLKHTDATTLLRETIDECWDTDAEARLSANCVEERFKEMDMLIERKGVPMMSKNETSNYDNKKRNSSCSNDIINRDHIELSPLLETDTPASESNGTTMTNLDTPEQNKPDVNIELDRDRLLAPTCGRNILAERNTMRVEDGRALALHDNTLIPLQEAKARQAAEEERSRRQWEETMANQSTEGHHRSRPPCRSVHLDIHNEVRDSESPVRPPKENNLNVRRHNSQRNIYESSTSSNGGNGGGMLTIPDCSTARPGRPKSLNLNIKPEST